MQSIAPNLKFILGWLKSPFAFRRSEVRHAGERRHPGSFFVRVQTCLDSGFRRNECAREGATLAR